MGAAAGEPDSTKAEPLIKETLRVCRTAAEWLSTLRDRPAAMGSSGPESITDLDLQIVCNGADVAHAPTCVDAHATGHL